VLVYNTEYLQRTALGERLHMASADSDVVMFAVAVNPHTGTDLQNSLSLLPMGDQGGWSIAYQRVPGHWLWVMSPNRINLTGGDPRGAAFAETGILRSTTSFDHEMGIGGVLTPPGRGCGGRGGGTCAASGIYTQRFRR